MTQELKAADAVLHMTVQITRKATGKVETYELIGTPVAEQAQPEPTPEVAKED
jgi:hypothetical protein